MGSTTPGALGLAGLQLAAHAASGFLLGLLAVVSKGLHPLDAILLLAMLQANVAQVSADRGLQVLYSALKAVPPDDLRRPISVTALAASLGLPFETTRRRLARLEKAGLCEASERGYHVPGDVLVQGRFVEGPAEIDRLLQRLHRRLNAAGCLDGLTPPIDPPVSFEQPPVRISARLGSDYFLRMLTLLTERLGDPVDGFLLLCIFKHNGDIFPAPVAGAEGGAWPPDTRLAAVRASVVARAIGLPHETVRRRLIDLEVKGLCVRVRGGWIIPAGGRGRLRLDEAMADNLANLRHMFATLGRMGVVGHWGAA